MRLRNGIAFKHLDRMTDSTGLIQHAIFSVPRRASGYTTDDNARALRLCARAWSRNPQERMLSRVSGYLSFLEYAHRAGGGFHNFLSYVRLWLDAEGCGDCQGQAVRALAEVLGSKLPDDYRLLARELIREIGPALADLRSLRAQAYVILAFGHLSSAGVEGIEPLECVASLAAQRMMECYKDARRPDWPWFESRMTYANAVLPHALFVAAQFWPDEGFLEVAETSFAFLNKVTTAEGQFRPVGNSGWYPHGEAKALYDQQPLEAATMAEAALAAFSRLGDEAYLATFRRAYDWFHGQNSLGETLVDRRTGACCDGLGSSGVNRNQGAESTLAYLWTELLDGEAQHAVRDSREVATLLA